MSSSKKIAPLSGAIFLEEDKNPLFKTEPPRGIGLGLGGLVLPALDVLVVVAAPFAPLDGPQGVYHRVYLRAAVVEAERYAHRAGHAAAVAAAYFLAQLVDAL